MHPKDYPTDFELRWEAFKQRLLAGLLDIEPEDVLSDPLMAEFVIEDVLEADHIG